MENVKVFFKSRSKVTLKVTRSKFIVKSFFPDGQIWQNLYFDMTIGAIVIGLSRIPSFFPFYNKGPWSETCP